MKVPTCSFCDMIAEVCMTSEELTVDHHVELLFLMVKM